MFTKKIPSKIVPSNTTKLLIAAGILIGSTGVSCDSDAQAVFRATATPGITSGIKSFVDSTGIDGGLATIVDAVIDGAAAAVQDAGRGGSSE